MALTIQERTNLIKLAVGLYNAAPGATYLNELATVFEANGRNYSVVADILSNSNSYKTINPASQTSQEFAASFLTPFGLQSNTEAVDFIVARLNAGASKGTISVQALVAINDSTNPVFANAKAILNNKAAVAENYSVTLAKNETNLVTLKAAIASVTGDVATVATAIAANTGGTGNEASTSFVLTVAQDIATGGTGADVFRGVAGVGVGGQDQTTLNSSDILDGAGGLDTLIVNMTGPAYNGGARIKNIETLQVGSNIQGVASFDYNVNQGQNEVTEVTKIVADQINLGEQLNIINILATTTVTPAVVAVAAVPASGTTPAVVAVAAVPAGTATAIPVLAWTNEAGSIAGTASFGFRESAVAGPTLGSIELNNVNAVAVNGTTGRLVLGGGVETVTIASNGGPGATTLNTSTNVDGNAADIVSGSNDGVNDNGVLTTVIVTGARTFGKAATVNVDDSVGQASFGLTNRVANGATDLGTDNTNGSASNLVSVAGTVTLVNATAASGGVNMRFLSKADNVTLTAVTFQGGAGADYVEFEQGAVNATGGAGNDTFSFVNSTRTSFDFGSNDTLVGGEGDDTIQIGLNGVGNMTLNTTEFNNKSGIETLDLRGLNNTVTLADAFVAGVDAGKTLTVRTDKIVQVSDASTANTAPTLATNNAALENNAISTVVLTQLAGNRAINFLGGSGSDRLVVNDASANQFSNLDGGLNAAVNSFDSLTVVNTSVLDANDVFNIRGFELLNLVESTTGNSIFNVEISERFLLANTSAANTLTVASVLNTYGTKLGAGDVVNFEVSNLLTGVGGAAKASIAGRILNVQDLVSTGVTVNYLLNGVSTPAVALAGGALFATVNTLTAPAVTLLANVPGGPLAVAVGGGGGGGVVGGTFTLTAANAVLTPTASSNVTPVGTLSTGNDTINASTLGTGLFAQDASTTDSDVLNVIVNAAISPALINIETINATLAGATLSLVNTTGTTLVNVSGANGGVTNIATGTVANLTAGYAGAAQVDFLAGAAANTIRLSGTVAGATLSTNSTAATINVAAASALNTLTAGAGPVVVTGAANLNVAAFGAGLTALNAGAFTGALTVGNIAAVTVTGGTGADSFTATTAVTANVNGGAGDDSFSFGTFYDATDIINGGLGIDTLNITNAGTVILTNVSQIENIVLSGTAATLTFVATNATLGTTLNVNGSAMTGVLTTVASAANDFLLNITGSAQADVLAGSARADTIVGGAGNDRITSGATADALTGGVGVDTFVLSGAAANVYVDSLATTAEMDRILDFVAGTDKIGLVNTGTAVTSVTVTAVTVATAADVATLLTAIGTQVAASAGAAANAGLITVTAGAMAGTYLFVNDATNAAAATDSLISLIGVTGTITAADFVFV